MAAPQAPPPPPPALFRSPAIARQRQQSRQLSDAGSSRRRKIGEVAGGATADVAAVACCFPCAVVELAVLAVYKVPAGMCRKAWKRNRRLRMERRRRAMSMPESGYRQLGLAAALDDGDLSLMRGKRNGEDDVDTMDEVSWGGSADMDSDGWDQFYANGFWRSDDREDDYHHHLHH